MTPRKAVVNMTISIKNTLSHSILKNTRRTFNVQQEKTQIK